jgi:hypothetical protein
MSSRGRFQRGSGAFNRLAWSWCRVHSEGDDWAMQAVLLERHRELSARVWSLWSGVQRCRQGRVTFRATARLVELTPVALVGFGSDGGVQDGGGTTPCRIEC